jgi:hypothetical protein
MTKDSGTEQIERMGEGEVERTPCYKECYQLLGGRSGGSSKPNRQVEMPRNGFREKFHCNVAVQVGFSIFQGRKSCSLAQNPKNILFLPFVFDFFKYKKINLMLFLCVFAYTPRYSI